METLLTVAAIIGVIPAIWFIWNKIATVFGLPPVSEKNLSAFIVEGQELHARANEGPLPVEDHNAWVTRMVTYFRNNEGRGYEACLSDFSGMTFYGDASDRSKYLKSIDGRLRRLHEFLSEL